MPPTEDLQINESHTWQVIDRYFAENGLVRQQVDSFNRFINDISEVIKEYGSFQIVSKDQYELNKDRRDDIVYEFRFDDKVYRNALNHKN